MLAAGGVLAEMSTNPIVVWNALQQIRLQEDRLWLSKKMCAYSY